MNNIDDIVYVPKGGKCKSVWLGIFLNLTFQCIRVDVIVKMQFRVESAQFVKNLNVFHHGVFLT
jgi:hypothetical protein